MDISSKNTIQGHIRTFESLTGLTLSFRALTPEAQRILLPQLEGGQQIHRHPFCMDHKERDVLGCKQDCHAGCTTDCSEHRTPFLRRCHHGAWELVAPLWQGEWIAVIIHGGPFTFDSESCLPRRTHEEIEQIKYLLEQFEAWLMRWLTQKPNTQQESDDRPIEQFLESQISRDPSLNDLAHHLGCSPSGAAARVRRVCGISWRAVKEQHRLQKACYLLLETNLPIYRIAQQIGFRDPDYFVRYFRTKMSHTPAAWRREQRGTDLDDEKI